MSLSVLAVNGHHPILGCSFSINSCSFYCLLRFLRTGTTFYFISPFTLQLLSLLLRQRKSSINRWPMNGDIHCICWDGPGPHWKLLTRRGEGWRRLLQLLWGLPHQEPGAPYRQETHWTQGFEILIFQVFLTILTWINDHCFLNLMSPFNLTNFNSARIFICVF